MKWLFRWNFVLKLKLLYLIIVFHFFDMLFQFIRSAAGIVAIIAKVRFFSCMNQNMSLHSIFILHGFGANRTQPSIFATIYWHNLETKLTGFLLGFIQHILAFLEYKMTSKHCAFASNDFAKCNFVGKCMSTNHMKMASLGYEQEYVFLHQQGIF